MEDPIVIRFRWTAEELMQASKWNFRHSCRPVLRAALPVMWATLMLAGLFGFHKGSAIPHSLAIGFLTGGICWFTMRVVLRKWLVRRHFNQRPDRDIDIEKRVNAEKVWSECKLGQSEASWEAFSKIVKTPDGVLLYPFNQLFHWVPRSGFSSDSDFEKFVTLAKNRIPKFYEVH